MNKKRFNEIVLPFLYILGMFLVCGYFISNPGTDAASNLLNVKNISKLVAQHIILVLASSLIAVVIAIPLAILVTRPRFKKLVTPIDSIVNFAQTIPSMAVLAIFYVIFGLGFWTALFALILKTVLPIFRNTMAGILNVPSAVIESANGMGMRPKNILLRVELPIALPVIMSGLRVAIVFATSNATLAAYIGAGGLGDLVVTGIFIMQNSILLTGAITVAFLALLFDNILGTIENHLILKQIS